jgi:hypothetical protein
VPVPVSFDTRWKATNGFVGDFMHIRATFEWSVEEPAQHFRFVSDAVETSATVGGTLGRERNGKFFS